jgi:hypothetical protein
MTTVHVVGDVTEAKPLMVSVICSIMFHVFIFIFMSSKGTVKPETRLGYESFNFLESQYSVPWSPKSVDSVRQLVLQARNKKQNNLFVFFTCQDQICRVYCILKYTRVMYPTHPFRNVSTHHPGCETG